LRWMKCALHDWHDAHGTSQSKMVRVRHDLASD